MSGPSVDRNPVEQIAEEFARRLRRGEHPSITEYVERFPELADDIRELFPMLAVVEQFKPATGDGGPDPAESVDPARGAHPEQLGDYRILRYLGEGGMGIVYEAVREALHNHVALKVMHRHFRGKQKYLRRFVTEARSAARLHHTNIVSVFDYGVHDGVCFYAMQYIAGQSLDKILDDVRRLRKENDQPTPGATEPSPPAWSKRDWSAIARRVFGPGEPGANSLRQTVTVGFLTGSYDPAACAAEAPDSHDVTPQLANPTATAEPGGLGVTATAQLGMAVCDTGDVPGPTAEPLHGVEPTENADGSFPEGSTSTLTGKADDCYYREVARLAAQVAEALAYAHKRGVFHRDIKPPNLILDPLGNIWITDFGLAKLEEGEDLSRSHDVVGTLRYMAPERFRGDSDGRCDVYALGATLYEMLTLRRAFEGENQLELIHRIENDPPVPPRRHDGHIPRDLETIVLKALAKDPEDRFATAEKMAKDLRLFLENRPITSRPIPFYQQFWRWCQRNPWLAGANITAAALTTILAVVSTFAWLTDRNRLHLIVAQRDAIQKAEAEGREQLFESRTSQARATRFSRRMGQRFESLKALNQAAAIGRALKLPPERFETLRDQAIACMALPDLEPTGRVLQLPVSVNPVSFDLTMTRYALRFRDGTISVRRVTDDNEIARFHVPRGDGDIWVFGFSPDGRYLATTHQPGNALTVWDIDRDRVALDEKAGVGTATFSPDSRRIALARDRDVVVHDLATGRPKWRWLSGCVAFRKDGAQVALIHQEKTWNCLILETETGKIVRSIPLPTRPESVAWSPDGGTLATPCVDYKIYLWDTATGARKTVLAGHSNDGLRAAFDPSGAVVASNDFDARLRLWDPVLGHSWLNLNGRTPPEFSADGRIAVSLPGKLATYQLDPALEFRSFVHAASPSLNYGRPSIQAGGRLLAVGTSGGIVLWDLVRWTELAFLPIGYATTMFEPSGDLLSSGDLGVWRWPVRLDIDRNELRIGPPIRLPLPPSDCGLDEDRSGRIVALADRSRAHVLTPERSFQVGPLDDCRGVSLSPDGRWLATNRHGGGDTRVWCVQDGKEVLNFSILEPGDAVFSTDGNWLMGPSGRRWEVGTWREAPKGGRAGHCFSPDGQLVVVTDADKIQCLVEAETGRTLARLESPDQCGVWGAAFSPDGTRLVLTTNDGPAVHVWDLRAIRRKLAEMGLDWEAPAYPETDSATQDTPASPLHVVEDLGSLGAKVQTLLQLEQVKAELESLIQQAHRLEAAGKFAEAVAALRQAALLAPGISLTHNNLAWMLATAPEPFRNPTEAVEHARRAVELAPGNQLSLNTLGVALYRAGNFAESIEALEKSLAAGKGQLAAFDLFFLSMAHHRLGHREAARGCFGRALRWLREQKSLDPQHAKELAGFRGEAEALLAEPVGEQPAKVFAGEQ